MERRELSPLGSAALGSRPAPDGQGDELAYDRGGSFTGIIGVVMICVFLLIGGLSILQLSVPTVAVVTAVFGILGSARVYYQAGIAYPRRRAEQMRQQAAALGLDYRADVPPELLQQLKQVPPFSAGHSHRAGNLIAGAYQGTRLFVFDCHYETSVRRRGGHRWQTVVLIPDVVGEPDFQLVPRWFAHQLAALLGSQDIRFSGDAARERFASSYLLCGVQQQAIHAAFDHRAVEFFANHPGWTVICGGGNLVICRTAPTKVETGAHFKLSSTDPNPSFRYVVPAAIPALLARVVAIRRLFH